jgi:hypothetical protein
LFAKIEVYQEISKDEFSIGYFLIHLLLFIEVFCFGACQAAAWPGYALQSLSQN